MDWDLSAAEKEGHDWFMLKEISEQPRAVSDTLLGRRTASGQLKLDEMRLSDQELRDIDKIIIVACGTSFHAGLIAKYAIEHWTRIPVEVELAWEFRYRDPILDDSTLVIAIPSPARPWTPSGGPARSRPAIEGAGRLQHERLDDPARVRRRPLHPRGPGVGVASPKGFLTPLVACYLVALYLGQVQGTRSATRSRR